MFSASPEIRGGDNAIKMPSVMANGKRKSRGSQRQEKIY